MQVRFHARSPQPSHTPQPSNRRSRTPRSDATCHAEIASPRTKAPRREKSWEELIESRQSAVLEFREVGDAQAREVAEVCLAHAPRHAEQVRIVLYANSNVRQEAARLLEPGANAQPHHQMALARCYLEAGFALPADQASPEVAQMLRDRSDLDTAHWAVKRDKHGLRDAQGQPLRMPYFYVGNATDKRYSIEDRNCELVAATGELLECRHLQQAAAGSDRLATKQFLSRVSVDDVRSLEFAALERAYVEQAARAPTINFSRRKLGALMRRLVLRMAPGDSRSFYVGWLSLESHSMRVFLRRELNGRIWVGHYDPSASGNINHLSVLPEHLARLDFNQFDSVNDEDAPEVLSLAVDSPWLARCCAGLFVAPDAPSQFASLCQALADGNVAEMEHALEMLGAGPWPFDAEAAARMLSQGLHHALVNGRALMVERFMAGLVDLRSFNRDQIAQIAAAGDERAVSGLYFALGLGHAAAVRKFLAGLAALGLSQAQIREIVEARDGTSTPGVYFARQGGHASTVEAYLSGLRDMGLDLDLDS
ncbi:MAG: hypothetical protein V4669_11975 [Pseudomonadota bacterium]